MTVIKEEKWLTTSFTACSSFWIPSDCLNSLLCQGKETQEACETVWTEQISACPRLHNWESVSYICRILLLRLLCITLASWGFSRHLTLFFTHSGSSLTLPLWLQHRGKQWIHLINDELLCVIHTWCYDAALCLLLLRSKLFWSWWITPAFWGEHCTSVCISAETFGCKWKRNTPVWSPLLHKKGGKKNHSTYKQQQENENLLHA